MMAVVVMRLNGRMLNWDVWRLHEGKGKKDVKISDFKNFKNLKNNKNEKMEKLSLFCEAQKIENKYLKCDMIIRW